MLIDYLKYLLEWGTVINGIRSQITIWNFYIQDNNVCDSGAIENIKKSL